MSVTDDLLRDAEHFVSSFDDRDLPVAPARRQPVPACMDSRIDVFGSSPRPTAGPVSSATAGGVVTDDAVRSIVIPPRRLGIVLVHPTDRGMAGFTDDGPRAEVEAETGIRPPFGFEAFSDADVRRCMAGIEASAFIPHEDDVRGFVHDVGKGTLRAVG